MIKKGKKIGKKKKEKDDNILPVEKIIIENSESNFNYYESIDNEIEKDVIGRKRTRNENKLIGLFKRVKRDKNNKNVLIIGSKQNPKSILISKKIYDPNNEYQEKKKEKEKKNEKEEEKTNENKEEKNNENKEEKKDDNNSKKEKVSLFPK